MKDKNEKAEKSGKLGLLVKLLIAGGCIALLCWAASKFCPKCFGKD